VPYEAVIGLEVHIQLRTETKLFCRCPNRFGAPPNTLVCPVCLGYPGALPVLNRRAVELAVRLASALEARIHLRSAFARKSYFYPDLPKGYQITQHDRPLATDGRLPLTRNSGAVGIERLHLEEDAGKLLHRTPGGEPLPGRSWVDFNRCGVPLVEVVTRPQISTPEEAKDFLRTLRQTLLFTATSDGSMEEGSLRCDANISLRRPGEKGLGTKTEVKNLNSFRHVARALEHEIERQSEVLDRGELVVQETRSFDASTGVTRPLRGKEEAPDYRYFPEPDLPELVLAEDRIAEIEGSLPELPWALRERLADTYGLTAEQARVLGDSSELAAYFEDSVAQAVAAGGESTARSLGPTLAGPTTAGPTLAQWVRTEILGELGRRGQEIADAIDPARLAALVTLVEEGDLSARAGKTVLAEIWETGEDPATAVERLGLSQVEDPATLTGWIEEVLDQHPQEVARYREGETRLLGFFIGQVMRRSRGRAAPQRVRDLLREALTVPATSAR